MADLLPQLPPHCLCCTTVYHSHTVMSRSPSFPKPHQHRFTASSSSKQSYTSPLPLLALLPLQLTTYLHQMRNVLSEPALTKKRPCGSKRTAWTASVWPRSLPKEEPSVVLNSLISVSSLAAAMTLPLRSKATCAQHNKSHVNTKTNTATQLPTTVPC